MPARWLLRMFRPGPDLLVNSVPVRPRSGRVPAEAMLAAGTRRSSVRQLKRKLAEHSAPRCLVVRARYGKRVFLQRAAARSCTRDHRRRTPARRSCDDAARRNRGSRDHSRGSAPGAHELDEATPGQPVELGRLEQLRRSSCRRCAESNCGSRARLAFAVEAYAVGDTAKAEPAKMAAVVGIDQHHEHVAISRPPAAKTPDSSSAETGPSRDRVQNLK